MGMGSVPIKYTQNLRVKISDGRYDTKSIDTTDTILSKMSINTTNLFF